jgi:hypothetical protein
MHRLEDFAAFRADVSPLIGRPDIERVARWGAEIDLIESGEMVALLGVPVNSTPDGYEKMDDAISAHRIPDADMIRYLSRRAYRSEWLY